MSSYEESYAGQLRQLVGDRMLLTPGVRGLIRNEQGQVLFIRRRDNGKWGIPAGAIELRETVFEALLREVKEETGLDVISATLVAVYSGEKVAFTSAYGYEYQGLVFALRVDEWGGDLVTETDETTDAQFLDEREHPGPYRQYREFLDDVNGFTGTVILK